MDLGDPSLYATTNRYEMWARYLANDAIVWSEPGISPGGFWSVFTHRACTDVLAEDSPFTSSYGMLIGFDAEHPDRGAGRMVVATDGKRHQCLRQLMAPALSKVAARSLDSFMELEVESLLEQARVSTVVDVAQDLAPRLPASVVCELLAVPKSDRDRLIELTNHAFASPDSAGTNTTSVEAHTEIFLYFHDLVAQRRHDPKDDFIGALLRDNEMDVDDVLINCYNVLIGGNQTSRHVIAGCFHAVSVCPDVLTVVSDEPATVPLIVEELIRWISPGMHVLRVAIEDVVLNGEQVRKGQAVVAWVAAANRDERVFDEPEKFVIGRRPNRHLGFGYGPHLCLGANVARLEIAILLRALAAQVRSVTLVGDPGSTRSNLIQGYRHLDVEINWRE